MDLKSKIILISGPTASGKSNFSIKFAKKINGEIINADSMQVYKQLKFLSARPDPKNYQKVKHHLYGFYDVKNNFEDFVNSTSIIWQKVETNYRKDFLKNNLKDFFKETNSKIAKKILDNYEEEILNFKQVCPIEMLDKLDNPITLKSAVKKVS